MKSIVKFKLQKPDGSRYYFALLASVLGLTVLAPLTEHHIVGRFLVGLLAILSLVIAVQAAKASRRSSMLVLVFAVITLIAWGFSFFALKLFIHPIAAQSVAYGLTLIFVLMIGLMMMKDIFNNEVNGNRVAGAICVYVLGGFFFAILHMMILLHDSHAYKDTSGENLAVVSGELAAQEVYPIFVYYSFCTLSTAGFGDIVPVSRTARTMSWLEAIAGQIYLTVLVARLVGLHIASSTSKPASASTASGVTDASDEAVAIHSAAAPDASEQS